MNFGLRILGSNSALPSADSFASAQVVLCNTTPYLIDCAEGTQMQMRKFKIPFGKLKNIFISHLHGDHFYGIFGLLSSFSLMGRKQKINLYAPSELENIINHIFDFSKYKLSYQLNFIQLKNNGKNLICEDKNFNVFSFPLIHSRETYGFLFQEKEKQPNIKKEYVEKYNISIADIHKIKNGNDFVTASGKTIKNSELTIPAPKSRAFAYCSDTMFLENLSKYFRDINLLYHEATFAETDKDLAKKTFHSTAYQAGMAAKHTNAGKLIIGHFSTRYKNTDILVDEAKQIFSETIKAEDGLYIEI